MNMERLYEEMKAFLKYVGLSFNEMDQVTVAFCVTGVRFTYGGITTTVSINPMPVPAGQHGPNCGCHYCT